MSHLGSMVAGLAAQRQCTGKQTQIHPPLLNLPDEVICQQRCFFIARKVGATGSTSGRSMRHSNHATAQHKLLSDGVALEAPIVA